MDQRPGEFHPGCQTRRRGHPAPFHLQYLGIGHEDKQTEVFRERFKLI
jgi:alpha-L-arabinofuranosidase